MSIRKRKTDKADLRNRYRIYVEVGLVLSLLLLIAAFSLDLRQEETVLPPQQEQEVVQMEEIKQTTQVEKPPPPPKPPVPVEVPNDEVLEDEELNLDASLDLDDPVQNEAPPPPPPAEEEEEEEPETFVIVENMPEMKPNRQEGMRKLQGCVKYPEMAKRAGVEGRVFVQFVVNENGQVVNPTVTRGIGAGTDEEALRCVRQMEFTPGMQRGKPVRVKMSLPVTFKLR